MVWTADNPAERGSLYNFWDRDEPDFTPDPPELRSSYDAVVVGAGYSGLAVAWGLSKNGFSVLVLEERSIGFGASSRNGGMVGPSFHPLGMVGLTRRYGEEKAKRIMQSSMDALDYFQDLIVSQDIKCDFQLTGRFRGARTKAHLQGLIGECERLRASVGLPYEIVAGSDLSRHTGSSAYVGGVFYPKDGGVHPKRLVNALARRAVAAGVDILVGNPLTRVRSSGTGFLVDTPRGCIRTREMVIATNGYSDRRVPEMNGRIVPIDVTVCATGKIGRKRLAELSPRFQMHGETGRVFIWSRPTPDRERFIFGGRISDPRAPFAIQREQVAKAVRRIHPDLAVSDFESIWHGKIAYSADHSAHLNKLGGYWLIGGYCGSGVTRSLYFADKLVRKIVGLEGSGTPLDDVVFPRVPLRTLAPLGARILTKYYAFLDRLETGRAKP